MKKILLGIDGIIPCKNPLLYTLDLANNLRAGVDIFEVISSPSHYLGHRRGTGWIQTLDALKGFIEGSILATMFAESSHQEISRKIWKEALDNLLPFKERIRALTPVPRLIIKQGNLMTEMVKHIHEHREIIMAVLSHREMDRRKKRLFKMVRGQVDIPLVLVRE